MTSRKGDDLMPPPEAATPPTGRAGKLLLAVEEWGAAAILLGMTFLGVLPILSRGRLGAMTSWAEPLTRHMVLWLALFGAIVATADRKHIAIDAVGQLLPRRWRIVLSSFTQLLAAGAAGLFAAVSFIFVREERAYAGDATAFLGVPEWCLQLVLPVGFTVLALRLLLASAGDLRQFFASRRGSMDPPGDDA